MPAAEPAGDLLALMARRVFAQQSVAMNRVSLQLATVLPLPRNHSSLLPALIHTLPCMLQISSSGLLSELAAQSSQPTLNTPPPSGRDPVLPRIRVRMPSSNMSTSG